MPPHRSILSRLPRLHWFSWCLGLVAAAILAIIVVSGEFRPVQHEEALTDWDRQCQEFYQATHDEHYASVRGLVRFPHLSVRLHEHGWPQPFLVRALVWKKTPSGEPHRRDSEALVQVPSYFPHWGGSSYHHASWSDYDNWPFSADAWLLRPGWLAIDLVVAAGLVALVAGASEWRIRRRKGLFRFGLADLLGAVTLIGLGLGYYTYHARVQQVESQGNGRPLPPGFTSHHGVMTSGQSYRGPVWLRKLAGNMYYLRTLHHVNSVSIRFAEHWEEAYAALPEHPYLERVRARQGLPLAGIEYLERCPRLGELVLPKLERQPRRVPPLAASVPTLTAGDLGLLAPLGLVSIEMSGDAIGAAEVAEVAAFPTVRSIELEDVAVTADELDAIRARHPQVTITLRPSVKMFSSP